MRLEELNALAREGFVAHLGHVFEHSPWVAQRAWDQRPFASIDEVHARMVSIVDAASHDEQLALIRAHPELMGRLPQATPLSAESVSEQAAAGLRDANEEELARLSALNAEYRDKFGFPFILAVRGVTREQILESLSTRVRNSAEGEFAQCLAEIGRIARFRIEDALRA